MVDSANDLNGMVPRNTESGPSESEKNSINRPFDSSLAGDSAELQPEFVLKFISAQIGQLKSELPGIISDAVLSQVNQEVMQKAPIAALKYRLDRPLQYYLRSGNKISEDLVLDLREIIQQFKDEIPTFREQSLLIPLSADSDNAAVLDALLASLSSHLDGIISALYQSLTI